MIRIKQNFSLIHIIVIVVFGLPVIFVPDPIAKIIIAVIGVFVFMKIPKWSESHQERKTEKRQLRKAQLNALKKGKVNIEIKGKMKKLK